MRTLTPIDVWEAPSVRRTITTVDEASNWLIYRWPEAHLNDPARQAATAACLAALDGSGEAEAARAAFVTAAETAHILAD
ncbi:DUF982 domain-containing protein [Nitrospirillum viridazoti]|uniref:Uncharacterized protein DUF982 n=1 Tax=Nitrospirillum amazonense TaxID=28077 RepID=A0A560H322_9PROT|nr:DUF982 domain-containing protein [Nitrospirillum amazonense]TWB40706.1 uncharacterized protein DUF982 [Nitrospirillum amazonense]TWB52812.1 uncharacterized protein DUF982 [Nitrospirillum amazonense]